MGEGADRAEILQLPLPEVGAERLRLRQPGRPKGAEDRSKRQLREYLAGLGYRDPAVVLAETFSRPVAELQAILNDDGNGGTVTGADRITRAEAYAMQLKAAAELMPYLHGKMPPVELQPEEALPLLIIETGSNQVDIDRGRIDGGQRDQVLTVGRPIEENQGLGEAGAAMSHDVPVSRPAQVIDIATQKPLDGID